MTRQAADLLGATKMDRPEWIAVHPETKEVYSNLTNNTQRGKSGKPPTDAANPRVDNAFGHIIRWREAGNDSAAQTFAWDIFVLAGIGDAANADKRGNINGDLFGSPDGLWFDAHARLWIETDVSPGAMNQGDYTNMGNNQLLVADVVTGEVKRFLTGPVGCEITGIISTPDGRHLFVNIQHPGETPGERSDPNNPMRFSAWPDGARGGRPRSATIVIRKIDGGVIGT
jgi:secreted PhoX family phosphatase